MDNDSTEKNSNSKHPILGNSLCKDLYDVRKTDIINDRDLLSSALISSLSNNPNITRPSSPRNSLQLVQKWQNLQRRMENICNNNPIYQALNNTLNQEYSSMSVPNQSQRLDPIPTYTPPEEQYPTQINIDGQGKRILNTNIARDFGNKNIGLSGGYSPGNINVGATYKKDKLSLQSSGTFGKDNSINPIFEYNSKNYGNFKVNSKIHPKNLQDSEGNVEWNWKF